MTRDSTRLSSSRAAAELSVHKWSSTSINGESEDQPAHRNGSFGRKRSEGESQGMYFTHVDAISNSSSEQELGSRGEPENQGSGMRGTPRNDSLARRLAAVLGEDYSEAVAAAAAAQRAQEEERVHEQP